VLVRLFVPVLLLCAMQVFAQDKEPVVLVWGEHLAAANAREAPGTRSYLDNIARALDAVGIKYARAKDSDLPGGALEGRKFAIFPYNSNLTAEERAAIRKFVAGGGKLWASLTNDPVLDELLRRGATGGRRQLRRHGLHAERAAGYPKDGGERIVAMPPHPGLAGDRGHCQLDR